MGRYTKATAIAIRQAAKSSIGSDIPMQDLELRHTIALIQHFDQQIAEVDCEIKTIMDTLAPPLLTIPGISYCLGAMILAEIGDITRFSSPDKVLAYAGMAPSTFQSGKFIATHNRMEKRGSKYLRYALFNAAKGVCQWEPTYALYLAKKRAEGKHYNVAISHAVKKLVRLIYKLQTANQVFQTAA